MKLIDIIIDSYWVSMMVWLILYGWAWSGIHCPLLAKDILYALTSVMDWWMMVNAVIGTVRFVLRLRRVNDKS